MSLALWLSLARDVAALLAIAATMLSLAAFWSSETGTGGGLAASVLVIAAAGVGGLCLHGLLSGGVGLPGGAIAVAMVAVLLALSFFLTHVFGVRGLWVSALTMVGFGFAGGMIWAFAGRIEAYAGGIGPILAFALLTVLVLGALGALAGHQNRFAAAAAVEKAAADPTVLADASPQPRKAMIAGARRLLATPPPWFDCAYATLGGEAVQPGKCAFTPPKVATAPAWSAAAEAPDAAAADAPAEGLAAADRSAGSEEAAEAQPPVYEKTQPEQSAPASPSIANPAFDTASPSAGSAPPSPGAIEAPPNRDAPAAREALSAPDGASETVAGRGETPAAPTGEPASENLADGGDLASEAETAQAPAPADGAAAIVAPQIGADAPGQPSAPPGDAAPNVAAAAPVGGLIEPGETRAEPSNDDSVASGRSAAEDRRVRSDFICFPMTALAADRLCPDQRFGAEDIGVRWLMRGGEAVDAPDSVECAVDNDLGLHATLFVNLSGDLAAPFAASTEAGGVKLRKAEALYDAATRVIGGVRGGSDGQGATMMSLYAAGASSLQSPWAEQNFSPDRADKLFDVASSGQALAFMRRLKSDTQAVRKNTVARDLAAALEDMLRDRPQSEDGAQRSITILATDALATESLTTEAAERVGALFAAKGLPIIAIELGLGSPSGAITRLAERSGGSAFSAGDAETLYRRMREALEQGRRFCAVRVSAPDRFFREGALQLRLRRRLTDGCALEQIATISCDGLSFEERIEPKAN